MFVYLFYSVEIAVISAVAFLTNGWKRLESTSGPNRYGGELLTTNSQRWNSGAKKNISTHAMSHKTF